MQLEKLFLHFLIMAIKWGSDPFSWQKLRFFFSDLEKRAEKRRKKALEDKQAELNREAGLPPLEKDMSANKRRRTTRIPSIRVKQEPKTYVPPIPGPPPPKRMASPPSMP